MISERLYSLLLCAAVILPGASAAQLTEGFDNITTLPGSGWAIVNNSVAAGSTSWFQGTPALTAQSGAANSYIAANFNAAAFGGNISLWLITPLLTLDNGVTISFYTASTQGAPDNLEVRYSTNGASANVGANATSVGDFTNLLLAINPSLTGAGYPSSFTGETATISGLAAPVTGRFAFRYDVPDTSTNGDFIGLDTVSVSSAASATPEPATLSLGLLGLAFLLPLAARRKHHSQ